MDVVDVWCFLRYYYQDTATMLAIQALASMKESSLISCRGDLLLVQ